MWFVKCGKQYVRLTKEGWSLTTDQALARRFRREHAIEIATAMKQSGIKNVQAAPVLVTARATMAGLRQRLRA